MHACVHNSTSTAFLFHPLALRSRHASSLTDISSWTAAHYLKLSLNNAALLFPLESPALCKASPSPLTAPRLLLKRLPRLFVCFKTANCQAAPRVQPQCNPTGLLFKPSNQFNIFSSMSLQRFFIFTLAMSCLGYCSSHELCEPLNTSPRYWIPPHLPPQASLIKLPSLPAHDPLVVSHLSSSKHVSVITWFLIC